MRGKSVWDRIRALRAQAGVKNTPGARRTKAETLVNNFVATGLMDSIRNVTDMIPDFKYKGGVRVVRATY